MENRENIKEYTLNINEIQAKCIKVALEEYFRIRMNQWRDLATDLALIGYVYNHADPDNKRKFDDCLKRRDETEVLLKMAMMVAQPQRLYSTVPLSEENCIAQDIWQVIRHQLYLDNGGDPNGWCVDARPPLPVSGEPLPVMRRSKKCTE